MIKTILWASDTHFNLAKQKNIKKFIDEVNSNSSDMLLITGDISEAPYLHEHLEMLETNIKMPIYFIIGNHDFYHSSIDKTLFKLSKFVDDHPKLKWLTKEGIVELNEKTCLIGNENWWDGYYGYNNQTFLQEFVMRHDYKLIEDLKVSKKERVKILQRINNICLNQISNKLNEALTKYDKIFLAAHVPPFPENCSFSEIALSDEWLFHTCSYSLGILLMNTMKQYPEKQLIVLSGHVHDQSFFQPLPNLISLTAKASYCKPKINSVIVV